uniref:Bee-milk protein n=1 Tax=Steinernema glaseri TaxID=37863 RepID=A0A1I7YSC6_9BILA
MTVNVFQALIGDDRGTLDWLAWTLPVNNTIVLYAHAPAQNYSVSYPLKFKAINMLGITANPLSKHSAQILFAEPQSSNLWFVQTEKTEMNVKSRPRLPEDCRPFAVEQTNAESTLLLCRNLLIEAFMTSSTVNSPAFCNSAFRSILLNAIPGRKRLVMEINVPKWRSTVYTPTESYFVNCTGL